MSSASSASSASASHSRPIAWLAGIVCAVLVLYVLSWPPVQILVTEKYGAHRIYYHNDMALHTKTPAWIDTLYTPIYYVSVDLDKFDLLGNYYDWWNYTVLKKEF